MLEEIHSGAHIGPCRGREMLAEGQPGVGINLRLEIFEYQTSEGSRVDMERSIQSDSDYGTELLSLLGFYI